MGDKESNQNMSVDMVSRFDLARLIQPLDKATFMREHWETKPLIIARQDPHYYDGLLSLLDVDELLSTSNIRSSDLRVVHEGVETPLASLLTDANGRSTASGDDLGLEKLYSQYREGSTVIIQFLHERWKPLKLLCQTLAAEFSAAFQVNVYLTPPHNKGLGTHYDTHDVFVLQTEGTKYWRLFENQIRLPLAGQPFRRARLAPEKPLREVWLGPGDLLYLPRGYLHDASSGDSTSLHLTVGVRPITWAFVILQAVESAIQEDSRLRESLPAGFAINPELQRQAEVRLPELLEVVSKHIVAKSVISEAVNKALADRQPLLDRHLLDLKTERSLQLETLVKRRTEMQWSLTHETDGDSICLQFHGKVLRMPAYAEKDLLYLIKADETTAAELPGELDNEGRLVLVRTLLREGFLTTPP